MAAIMISEFINNYANPFVTVAQYTHLFIPTGNHRNFRSVITTRRTELGVKEKLVSCHETFTSGKEKEAEGISHDPFPASDLIAS
ncbi:hypothetical protein HDF18_14265 [Mucilaginibacter sp. X5P1]|uniref:hypothetical protein n=1 Tax=Mucilaginibacter sp. X5P1 TaxID=2723088 RepID=UPI00160A8EEC|nr:hypothetical protein [Mucilaginibacter sp. X5P1]MBB6138766.1 hypothetical protein [Mucilaginibacter sp. X5P1]